MQLAKLFPNAAIGQGYGKYFSLIEMPCSHLVSGLTETATTVCSLQPERMFGTIGSVGTLVPGITAKVVKSDGTLASEGEQGELVVKGPSMALGYYENPTAYVGQTLFQYVVVLKGHSGLLKLSSTGG